MPKLPADIATPAYVLDRHWDAIAWNKPAAELFAQWLGGGRAATRSVDRNLLRFVFMQADARKFIVGWSDRAQRLVADRGSVAECAGRVVGECVLRRLLEPVDRDQVEDIAGNLARVIEPRQSRPGVGS